MTLWFDPSPASWGSVRLPSAPQAAGSAGLAWGCSFITLAMCNLADGVSSAKFSVVIEIYEAGKLQGCSWLGSQMLGLAYCDSLCMSLIHNCLFWCVQSSVILW